MSTKVLDNVRTTQPRDTSANWTKYDPVLRDGEIIIVDTDAGEVRYKVGDGTKKYSQLPFDDEAIRTLIANKANDADVVHKANAETISGAKTFSSKVTANGGADIKSSGNAILNVRGVSTNTDYIDMYVTGSTNTTRPLVLQNNSSGSGNVGIGNATPDERLTVNGNVKATKFIGALDYSNLTNVPYIIKEYTNPALTSTVGVCEWTIDHNMGKSTSCRLFDTTLKEDIMATVITSDNNTIVVKFGSSANIAAGKYKATIIGYEVSA